MAVILINTLWMIYMHVLIYSKLYSCSLTQAVIQLAEHVVAMQRMKSQSYRSRASGTVHIVRMRKNVISVIWTMVNCWSVGILMQTVFAVYTHNGVKIPNQPNQKKNHLSSSACGNSLLMKELILSTQTDSRWQEGYGNSDSHSLQPCCAEKHVRTHSMPLGMDFNSMRPHWLPILSAKNRNPRPQGTGEGLKKTRWYPTIYECLQKLMLRVNYWKLSENVECIRVRQLDYKKCN